MKYWTDKLAGQYDEQWHAVVVDEVPEERVSGEGSHPAGNHRESRGYDAERKKKNYPYTLVCLCFFLSLQYWVQIPKRIVPEAFARNVAFFPLNPPLSGRWDERWLINAEKRITTIFAETYLSLI